MAEIADITPSEAAATDRLLVRRSGSAPYGLDLLSDITPEQLVALSAEIAAARADRSALADRISTISNFASPNAGGVVIGKYYDQALHGISGTLLTSAAGRVQMSPFYTSQRMRIDEIGVNVAIAGTDVVGKCFIYGSGPDGWPSNVLFEATNDLDLSTTNYKAHSIDFTFDSGRQYWIGVRTSGGGSLRAITLDSLVNLGLTNRSGSFYNTVLRRTINYATALPDPWVFGSTDAVSAVMPSIRMRAAAI